MTAKLQLGGYTVPRSILEPCDPAVRMRRGVEYAIVRKLIETLLADKNLELTIDHGGESDTIKIGDVTLETMEDMFACDEEYLFIKTKYGVLGSDHEEGEGSHTGWVRLVYGNDGWDVICDYTTNLEDYLKEVNEYAEQFGG